MNRTAFLQWLEEQELPRTPVYPCPYIDGREARQLGFAADSFDGELYHDLMDRGFRRAGNVFYAMECPSCTACVPLRIPVDEFRPSKSQRRTLRKNTDVRVEFAPPAYTDDAFEMYQRYLRHQHPDTPQDESRDYFRTSLYGAVVESLEARYLVGDRLIGVSLLDVCSRSLSAVYHFFEPAERHRRIGVLSAMLEIEHARQLGIPHYYFGYWIRDAKTMSYKADYRPFELLRNGVWKRDDGAGDGGATGPSRDYAK